MAKVRDPLHSVDASGVVGSDVHVSRRGSHIVRKRPSTTVTNTAAQIAIRSHTAACNVRWRALTQAQRNAWAEWADRLDLVNVVGAKKTITGHDAYIKTNVLLRRGSFAFRDTPPPELSAPIPKIGTYTYTSGTSTLLINFTISPADPLYYIEIRSKLNHLVTRSYHREMCRYNKMRSSSNVNVPILGVLPAGKHTLYIRTFHSVTGSQSAWVKREYIT